MISVEHLTKYYDNFLAVDDLSFAINDKKVYGFLGPNGAGKSTTMNIMTGCLSASDGKVVIDGIDIFENPIEAKKKIGYLPEIPPLYVNETPEEYLNFVGQAKGIKGEDLKNQIENVKKLTGINEVSNKLINNLSKGYRQRVGIAGALIGNPKIIILDEPTVGLDPLQIIEIRDLIKKLGEDHTVILSSHILSEVQAVCEEVLIISKGKLVAYDKPENLENFLASKNTINFTVRKNEEVLNKFFEKFNDCIVSNKQETLNENYVKVEIKIKDIETNEFLEKLFLYFASKKTPIIELTTSKANLEDVFIELTDSNKEDKQ